MADGHYGQKTHAAVAAYQAQHGLPADGLAGPNTLAMLASSPPVAQGTRDLATPDSLAQTTETGFGARLIKRISVATGIGSVGGKTVMDTVNGHIERVNELSWKVESARYSWARISEMAASAGLGGLVPSGATLQAFGQAAGGALLSPEVELAVVASVSLWLVAHHYIEKPQLAAVQAGAVTP